jgi:arginyl-tRNA synthetase
MALIHPLSCETDRSLGGRGSSVEFSFPNIAREFTAAHLRSTILAAFVADLYEAMGWDVARINYLGDLGKHLRLLGLGWQKYGSEGILNEQTDPFKYIHDLCTKMEDELRPEQEVRKKARDDGRTQQFLKPKAIRRKGREL